MQSDEIHAVLSNWGAFELVGPLKGGHRNKAFHVRGERGQFVLKSTRRSEAALAWLADVHETALESGIMVPKLVPSRNGLFVHNGWTLEVYIEGVHPTVVPHSWLSSAMKIFHEKAKHIAQRPGFVSSADLICVEQGGDIDLGTMPVDLVLAIRAAWESVSEYPTCVIHGDVNPSNILVVESGGFALLDWDETRVDFRFYDELQSAQPRLDSRMERAVQAYEIACSWQIEPVYAQQLSRTFLTE